MKEVQPHGPYNLVGMCEGALISFEMVRVLRAEGEQVNLLGMIDAFPVENTRRYYLTKIDSYRRRVVRSWRKLKNAAPNERAASAAARCRRTRSRHASSSIGVTPRERSSIARSWTRFASARSNWSSARVSIDYSLL